MKAFLDRTVDALTANSASRRAIIIGLHGLIAAGVYGAAFLLRFEGRIPAIQAEMLVQSLPFVAILYVLALGTFRLHQGLWSYASTDDLIRIVKASTVATLGLIAGNVLLLQLHGFPRSVYVLQWLGCIMAFGGKRMALRLLREQREAAVADNGTRVRTLIAGAGDAGRLALRALRSGGERQHHVLGFLDDDPRKQGGLISGCKVLGPLSAAPWVVEQHDVDEVLISMPSASKRVIHRLVESCADHKVRFRILPGMSDIATGRITVDPIREVRVEDLLGREPISLDKARVSGALGGKTVLVSGAAGSIGSELARQIAAYRPKELVLMDTAETPLFDIEAELKQLAPEVPREAVIGDIRNPAAMQETLARFHPDCVFHAAAYKHVPLMEFHPVEAVTNNVFGTRNLAEAAARHGVGTFVMISTDKAVKPRNVMGATKRAAEMLVTSLNRAGHTRFVAVRFGNVLGSSGSVIPTFRRQIAEGGPVTVTHPEATRFFMTIPEAVELVLQASSTKDGGNVFVLDMGTPVRIADLARNLIQLSGLTPGEDIAVEYTGLRPGEKLHEELIAYGENLSPTDVPKLSVLRHNDPSLALPADFEDRVHRLERAVRARDSQQTLDLLRDLVGETPTGAQGADGTDADRTGEAGDGWRKRVIQMVCKSADDRKALGEALGLIRTQTGAEAAALRLRHGEHFPYVETDGFARGFLSAENCFCTRDSKGELVRDAEGRPTWECMCGKVVSGAAKEKWFCFTENGSFWTNHSTSLPARLRADGLQARYRGRCNLEGYESVALFPLRANGDIIGLLQLNARRRGAFDTGQIGELEDLAAEMGAELKDNMPDQFPASRD